MRKIVLLMVFSLSISLSLFGQINHLLNMFDPETNDAKSEALGRTSILSSAGANFVFNNPSMLSNLTNKNVQFNVRSLFGKDEIKYQYENNPTDKPKYERSFHMKFNGVSFAIPYNLKSNNDLRLGFGAGYRTYYDWGFNISYKQKDTDYKWDKKFHGGFNTIVLGTGMRYKNIFLLGISFSMPFLSEFSTEYEDNDSNLNNDIDESEGTMKGTFVTLASSIILNKQISVGARLRTGYKIEIKDDKADIYNNEITIPSEFGVAISLKPTALIKLYVEYLSRGFGDYKFENSETNTWLYADSENGYSFRVGLEANEKESVNVFRAGFFMQSVPIYEAVSYTELLGVMVDSKPLSEMGFTTGFGLKISSNFSLDLYGVYSFLNYDESYIVEDDNDLIKNEYSYTKIKIGCSMGYNF